MGILSAFRRWKEARRIARMQSLTVDNVVNLAAYAVRRHIASIKMEDIPTAFVHKNTTRLALKQRLVASELAYNSMKTIETIIDRQNAQMLFAVATKDHARSICVAFHAIGIWAQLLSSFVVAENIRIAKAKADGKTVNDRGDVFVRADQEIYNRDNIKQQELFDDQEVS